MSERAVLLEVQGRTTSAAVEHLVDALLPDGAHRDTTVDPIAMDGGRTWIVRCVLANASLVTTLEAHPDVVHVWPDSHVAPM